jgi:hypothetical protein
VVARPVGPLLLVWGGVVAFDLSQAGTWRRLAFEVRRAALVFGWSSERRARYAEATENAREWLRVVRAERRAAQS